MSGLNPSSAALRANCDLPFVQCNTMLLHEFLDFLAFAEVRHEVCSLAHSWFLSNRRFTSVEHSLHTQPLAVPRGRTLQTPQSVATRHVLNTESVSSATLTSFLGDLWPCSPCPRLFAPDSAITVLCPSVLPSFITCFPWQAASLLWETRSHANRLAP